MVHIITTHCNNIAKKMINFKLFVNLSRKVLLFWTINVLIKCLNTNSSLVRPMANSNSKIYMTEKVLKYIKIN